MAQAMGDISSNTSQHHCSVSAVGPPNSLLHWKKKSSFNFLDFIVYINPYSVLTKCCPQLYRQLNTLLIKIQGAGWCVELDDLIRKKCETVDKTRNKTNKNAASIYNITNTAVSHIFKNVNTIFICLVNPQIKHQMKSHLWSKSLRNHMAYELT